MRLRLEAPGRGSGPFRCCRVGPCLIGPGLVVDAYAWGWWNLILGVLVIAIGAALMRGSMFARTNAVIVALAGLLSSFLFIPVMPLWSLTIIVVNVLVIWAVVVHGGEVKDM